MATTTNYGWTTPDDTALVKDGAAAIRTLGSSVDTTTKALNPSTTLGDIEYRSSTANTNTRLGIGTTGQSLVVSGGVPAWGSPAASSLTLSQIATGSLSGTSTSITGITQDFLFLYISNPKWGTGNGTMNLTFNSDSGANYNEITLQYDPNIDTYSGTGLSLIQLMPNSSQNTGNGRQWWITIPNAKAAGFKTWSMFGNTINTSGTQQGIGGSGIYTSATALTSIQIKQSDGYTFNAGTYTLWGA